MTQPTALFLADVLANDPCSKAHHDAAAAELRRLSSVEAQRDALLASLRVAVDSDFGRAWVWPDTAREQWMRDARAAIAKAQQ